jgi:5,10-methylenetetrahydrofolate reductase
VHCVTGDHPALGHRSDAAAVFDLDSVRLAALAASTGLLVSVAEAPAAPPVTDRPARLAGKRRAGARVCFVDHAGGPAAVGEFIAAARALGAQLLFVACVALVTSATALRSLMAFTRGEVPSGAADAAAAPDPLAAGVRAAVVAGEAMLAVDGVDGVDLSAPAPPGEELVVAGALATAAAALGGGS